MNGLDPVVCVPTSSSALISLTAVSQGHQLSAHNSSDTDVVEDVTANNNEIFINEMQHVGGRLFHTTETVIITQDDAKKVYQPLIDQFNRRPDWTVLREEINDKVTDEIIAVMDEKAKDLLGIYASIHQNNSVEQRLTKSPEHKAKRD